MCFIIKSPQRTKQHNPIKLQRQGWNNHAIINVAAGRVERLADILSAIIYHRPTPQFSVARLKQYKELTAVLPPSAAEIALGIKRLE